MGWKSVTWASCLLPVLAGCGSVHNLTTESRLAHAQRGIEHSLRADAQVAWQTVRSQHPQRTFTEEFRDGFLDGYVDYLDRGGAAQPPAVPPIKYVANKKYFTPEGHCLVRDYALGFKYGSDVAVASGRRQFLTVPVLLPEAPETPVAVANPVTPVAPPPTVPEMPPPMPLPKPRPVPDKGGKPPLEPIPVPPELRPMVPNSPNPGIPPLPKPELPIIKPFNPDTPEGGKFGPLTMPPHPDLLPVPNPPLPVPERGSDLFPLPVPTDESKSAIPTILGPVPVPVPVMKFTLPAPPDAVPTLPANVPTPSVLNDIPVIPFRHTPTVPVPVGNLLPGK